MTRGHYLMEKRTCTQGPVDVGVVVVAHLGIFVQGWIKCIFTYSVLRTAQDLATSCPHFTPRSTLRLAAAFLKGA